MNLSKGDWRVCGSFIAPPTTSVGKNPTIRKAERCIHYCVALLYSVQKHLKLDSVIRDSAMWGKTW